MHITLIKNSEDYIHHKDCSKQQQWQRSEQLPEHERFTLESALNSRVMRLELRKGVFDVLRGIADRDIRQQVEIECDTGELVEMIHRLRTNNFPCGCYNTHGDKGCHVTCGRGDHSAA